jgi:hypothetical protein
MVADNGYITDADAFSGDWNDLINVPVDIDDGDADTLADISCSATQVAKWNGANWACADDTDTVLDEADVDAFVSDNGFASASDIFSGVFSDLTGVPADADTLGMLVCPDEQVPVATGGGWICGDNNDASADIAALTSDIEALLERIEELESGASIVVGDGVLYGNYYIYNSVDLAGLAGYTEITGDLVIDSADLPSVGLENLTTIGGNLTVIGTTGMTSLIFDGLTSIGGTINISYNTALTSINWSDLTYIGGHITMYFNDALTSINLDGVTYVGDDIEIHDSSALVSISMSSLTSTVTGQPLRIYANPVLTNCDFSSLTSVGDHLYIQNNDSLSDLEGLSSLTYVDSWFEINANNALTDLNGLSNLTSVGGNLTITANDALTTLEGLNSLTSVGGSLDIRSNALTSLSLNSLTSVGDYLWIEDTSLTSLEGLNNLSAVGAYLGIRSNNGLTSLAALDNLTSVGALYIQYNSALCQSVVDAYVGMLESWGWSGYQYIHDNAGC